MLFIILWMLGFALIHSLTADKRLKARVRDALGERVYYGFYRLFYNVVSVVMLVPMLLYVIQDGRIVWQVPPLFVPLFVGIQLVGAVGLLVSVLQIDAQRFLGIRQVRHYLTGEQLPLSDEPLQMDGLYALVRHPLYLFSLLAIWFTPTMTNRLLALNLCITAYFVIGSRIEEQRMIDYYGAAYREYQQRVAWLLPNPLKLWSVWRA